MRKLFLKLLALLPRDSDGQELNDQGITWNVFEPDSSSPILEIRWGGLKIMIMDDQVNYPDKSIELPGSFEELIFRAVLAANEQRAYSSYIHQGKVGKLGIVRYILYKDLAIISNEIGSAELYHPAFLLRGNLDTISDSMAVGTVCRDMLHFPTHRTMFGWVVVLDKDKIEIGKLRFGIRDAERQMGDDGDDDEEKIE